MKKRTVIALIVAGVLLVAGGVLLAFGLSYAKDGTTQSGLAQKDVLITELFTSVQIDTEDCDVKFVPYNGAVDAQVVILEHPRTSHSVQVVDGTLQIKMTDDRKWTDHIGIFGEHMQMTVYLPEVTYASLQVRTATGFIRIPEVLSADEMILRSSTGHIYCEGAAVELLDCMTSTGEISVRGGAPAVTKLQSSTGDQSIIGSNGKQIHMKTSTGEIDAAQVKAELFTCSASTGEVELEDVVAEDYLQITTTTGDVGVENCDAGRVNIETDTGDVAGHFLTPKWFDAHSDTGNVTVPNTPDGGECLIQSDTGNIEFR